MTVVYFVRHAHSNYSSDEYNRPLSLKGLQDANLITEKLKDRQIDAVISSPYKRAIETVQGIAKWNRKQVITCDVLKERTLALGPVVDFERAINRVWNNPAFSYEGGESNLAAQRRVVPVFQKILMHYEDAHIVVGTHGNILTLILNAFNPAIGLTFWQELKMPDIIKVEFQQLELVRLEQIKY